MNATQRAVPNLGGPVRRLRVLLCINPASGLGRGSDAGSEAAARLRSAGVQVEILEVPLWGPQDRVERYAAALRTRIAVETGTAPVPGPDAVIVVGGDGMVHATVQALAGTGMPLGLVPAGTGNDFARTLGLRSGHSGQIGEAVDRAVRALQVPAHPVDLARVETSGQEGAGRHVRYVASCLNVGFDAAVNDMANHLRFPKGGSRYVLSVLAQLVTYRPRTLEVVYGGGPDGERRHCGEAFALMVMNGRYIGGGMEVTPDARVDDGLLDVLSVPSIGPGRFLREFPSVFSGGHTGLDVVHLHQVREMTVRAAPGGDAVARFGARTYGQVLHGDGEPLGRLPARVTVDPGALTLLDYRADAPHGTWIR
jgi:diacylglycerol kinase (ATP)